MIRLPPRSTRTDTLVPYTTLFRSEGGASDDHEVRLPGGNNFLCLFRRSDQSDGHGLHARFLTDLGTEGHLIAGRQRNLLTMVEAARGNIDIVAADRLQRLCEDDSLVRRESARSEEHTSELQSLMRISYAVFCLKKKKTT